METKSRYEAISDLEKQKRDLIRERDGLDEELRNKEKKINDHIRQLEGLKSQSEDFAFKQRKQLQDIDREKEDWAIKVKNTEMMINRNITDTTSDATFFSSMIEKKKETINELIKGVEAALARFSGLPK